VNSVNRSLECLLNKGHSRILARKILKQKNRDPDIVRRRGQLSTVMLEEGLRLAATTKDWIERNETQSRRHAKRLNSIVHLQFVIDIRQVEIHCALRNDELLSSFFATVTLSD